MKRAGAETGKSVCRGPSASRSDRRGCHSPARVRRRVRAAVDGRSGEDCRARTLSPHGDAWRLPYVGGDDELRTGGLGVRRQGVSLRRARPARRAWSGPRCLRRSPNSRRMPRARRGTAGFQPDACLINRYEPGARLTLHQDRNERDYTAPIVSVSLGLPAVFLFGGATRKERPRRMRLESGDIVVWGGSHAPGLPRHRVAKRRRAPAHRPLPHQPHLSQSAVGQASRPVHARALQ